ncbi:SDR family oxidoreductase [Natronorubrum tibetense]|uniref:3-ketoacyl-ACP reductase n=1 Tax=Natronorubrum tibetense GA33 TaxID=1114856 RepID=L9VKT4_9EURY|nr:SDR family oxidoreductase [Natronorubrum tibetense]ELY37759.1 3-ketoacyl-ACP reductase [Natronorubrum tibetense GA33]
MMDEISLDGRTAIVTGGGRGIGRQIALEFADRGVDVVVAARSEDEITDVASMIDERGGEAVAVPTDITVTDDVGTLFERAREAYDQVDILINNAGISVNETIWSLSDEEWQNVIDVNLSGTFRCTREALTGGMLERDEGTIINMSSLSGKVGFTQTGPYTASKHGVQGLTNVLSKELKETDIRVSAVCPGQVKTELTDDIVAVDRLETDDITDIVLFLATRPPSVYIPKIVAVPPESIPLVRH